MDPRRFDSLVRTFAAAGTRRRVVAVLAALPLVGGLAGITPDDVEAEKPRDRIKRRKDAHRRKRRNRKHHNRKHNNGNNGGGNGGGKGGGKGGSQPCTLNGGACQQNSDCCKGNCFGQVCANPPNQCGGTNCPDGSTGCCDVGGCCPSSTNQCNPGGECCAPNCGGKQCGPDGCGGDGTCGSCAPGQTCNLATAQCEGPVCSAASCPNGCCDRNGVCQPGTAHQQCGRGGVACEDCSQFQYCSSETGTCRDNPPCGPETCPKGCCVPQQNGPDICDTTRQGCTPGGACCAGCCDANNECRPGTGDGECGLNGSDCIVCDPLGGLCDNGRCQCDANNCPNGCCSNGPGNAGLCFVDDPRFCGTNGVACAACPDGLACNAQQQCVCTAQSCLPSTGRSCQGNQCLCDSSICDGCCQDGLCKPGTVVDACGNEGAECSVCGAGNVCVTGACCPDGTIGACANNGNCCPPGQRCCAPNQGENDFCCPSDQLCAGDRCCSSSAIHVCNSSYVGWECCDPPKNACCDDGNGGETCCQG